MSGPSRSGVRENGGLNSFLQPPSPHRRKEEVVRGGEGNESFLVDKSPTIASLGRWGWGPSTPTASALLLPFVTCPGGRAPSETADLSAKPV